MQHKCTISYGKDEAAISEVESEKDLDIIFDSEMKLQTHINDICCRGYQRIAVIRRPFNYMDKDIFLLLDSSIYFKKGVEKLVRKGSEKSHKNGSSH